MRLKTKILAAVLLASVVLFVSFVHQADEIEKYLRYASPASKEHQSQGGSEVVLEQKGEMDTKDMKDSEGKVAGSSSSSNSMKIAAVLVDEVEGTIAKNDTQKEEKHEKNRTGHSPSKSSRPVGKNSIDQTKGRRFIFPTVPNRLELQHFFSLSFQIVNGEKEQRPIEGVNVTICIESVVADSEQQGHDQLASPLPLDVWFEQGQQHALTDATGHGKFKNLQLMGVYTPPNAFITLTFQVSSDDESKAKEHHVSGAKITFELVPAVPKQSLDPISWTVSELEGFLLAVDEHDPSVLPAIGLDPYDGCQLAKLQWFFMSAPDVLARFNDFVANIGWPLINGEPVSKSPDKLISSDPMTSRSEEPLSTPSPPLPVIGAGFVPEEAFWVGRFLRSIDHPADKIVIRRDGPWPKGFWGECWKRDLDQVLKERPEVIYEQGEEQRGCSAGWNAILRHANSSIHEYVVIFNADTAMRPNAAAYIPSLVSETLAADSQREKKAGVLLFQWETPQMSWSAFVVPKRTLEICGYFDENYFPAFSEDNDYEMRLRVADLSIVVMPAKIRLVHGPIGAHQHISGHEARRRAHRIASVAPPRSFIQADLLGEGRNYQYMKWNYPGHCLYPRPYNMKDAPIGYWRLDEERIKCIKAGNRHCVYSLNDEEKAGVGEKPINWWWGIADACPTTLESADTPPTLRTAQHVFVCFTFPYVYQAQALREMLSSIGIASCLVEVPFGSSPTDHFQGSGRNDLVIVMGPNMTPPKGMSYILYVLEEEEDIGGGRSKEQQQQDDGDGSQANLIGDAEEGDGGGGSDDSSGSSSSSSGGEPKVVASAESSTKKEGNGDDLVDDDGSIYFAQLFEGAYAIWVASRARLVAIKKRWSSREEGVNLFFVPINVLPSFELPSAPTEFSTDIDILLVASSWGDPRAHRLAKRMHSKINSALQKSGAVKKQQQQHSSGVKIALAEEPDLASRLHESGAYLGLVDRAKIVFSLNGSPDAQPKPSRLLSLLARSKCVVAEVPPVVVDEQEEEAQGNKRKERRSVVISKKRSKKDNTRHSAFPQLFLSEEADTAIHKVVPWGYNGREEEAGIEEIVKVLASLLSQSTDEKKSRTKASYHSFVEEQINIAASIAVQVSGRAKDMRWLLPASHMIHSSKIVAHVPLKSVVIASPSLPDKELIYHEALKEARFRVTAKPEGWDEPEHLAAMIHATLPLVTTLNNVPMLSLGMYPKSLFRAIWGIPGISLSSGDLNPNNVVVLENELDDRVFKRMTERVLGFVRNKMSTGAAVKSMLARAGIWPLPKKVLYLGGHTISPFEDSVFTGLMELSTTSGSTMQVVDFPPMDRMFEEFSLSDIDQNKPADVRLNFYRALPVTSARRRMQAERDHIEKRIREKEFDLVVFAAIYDYSSLFSAALETLGSSRVMIVDGHPHGDRFAPQAGMGVPYFKKEVAWPLFPDQFAIKCGEFASFRPNWAVGPDRMNKIFRAVIPLFHESVVIDLGCGEAKHLEGLDLSEVRYVGVDVNLALLETAIKSFPKARFVHEDMIQYIRNSVASNNDKNNNNSKLKLKGPMKQVDAPATDANSNFSPSTDDNEPPLPHFQNAGLIICTNVLEYLPLQLASDAVHQITSTGAQFFLFTSHKGGQPSEIEGGMFLHDLMRRPFPDFHLLRSWHLSGGAAEGGNRPERVAILVQRRDRG